MGLKVGKSDAIVNSSVDTLTTCINDVRCTCVDFNRKKKKMITKSPKFFTVSSESVKKSYVKKKDVNRTLPFEIVMALNDIIKAKKPVED